MFSIIHSHQKIERQSLSLQPARAQAQCLSLVTMAWWEFPGNSDGNMMGIWWEYDGNMMGICDFPPSVRKITINIWMGWDITNHNHGFCGIYFGFCGWLVIECEQPWNSLVPYWVSSSLCLKNIWSPNGDGWGYHQPSWDMSWVI